MSYPVVYVDAEDIEMPVRRLPNEPYTGRPSYQCALCKAQSEYQEHSLKACVPKLAERLDAIENNADPRNRG